VRGGITLGAVIGGLLIAGAVAAQTDLTKPLVGRWEGEVDYRGVPSDPSRAPHRTLIVRSVTQKEGKWVAEGRFGIIGKGLAPVEMEVDTEGSKPSLRFVNGPITVRLQLLDDKHLAGTFTPPAVGRRGSEPLQIRLEKQE
jgi:hypothetical protein